MIRSLVFYMGQKDEGAGGGIVTLHCEREMSTRWPARGSRTTHLIYIIINPKNRKSYVEVQCSY